MKEQVIDSIIDRTAQFEGFSEIIYKCPAGFDTIGYGRNIEANPLKGYELPMLQNGKISKENAKKLLRDDLSDFYEQLCNSSIGANYKKLDLVRQACLLDMCFNMGLKTLLTFKKTLGLIWEGKYKEAANEMLESRWASQVGTRASKISNWIKTGEFQ